MQVIFHAVVQFAQQHFFFPHGILQFILRVFALFNLFFQFARALLDKFFKMFAVFMQFDFRRFPLDGIFNGHRQRFQIIRFGIFDQIIIRPRFHGFDGNFLIADAGDDHHRNPFHLREQIKGDAIAQQIIHDGGVKMARSHKLPRFLNRTGQRVLIGEMFASGEAFERHPVNLIILDK